MDNFIFFLKDGFYHVLDWNAYDHILFLIALTIVYEFNSWRKVLWMITLFTIGHTTSLLFAIYNVISINKDIIEFIIPLTIIITAIFNIIYTKKASINAKTNTNLFFALFFGIIHGFAFSSHFKMIVGTAQNKLISLIEFAFGIELAQAIIVIIILVLGLAFKSIFRVSKRDWILVFSSIIIGICLTLLRNVAFW